MGCGQGVQPILGNTPSSRAVNIRAVQRIGSAYPAERDTPLRLSSPLRHSCRFSFPPSVRHGFHLPALPSLHVHYRRFLATMGALTPAPEFPALRLSTSMNTGLTLGAGLPASRARPSQPFRLQPPNAALPPLSHATLQRRRSPAPLGASPGFAFPWQAHRSRQAESSSQTLRTGRSPPLASDITSW
jgi:hypothetical protein